MLARDHERLPLSGGARRKETRVDMQILGTSAVSYQGRLSAPGLLERQIQRPRWQLESHLPH